MSLLAEDWQAMADQRIPVFCHVGLAPTWYTEWTSGYVRVGKTAEDALKIFQQAYDYVVGISQSQRTAA